MYVCARTQKHVQVFQEKRGSNVDEQAEELPLEGGVGGVETNVNLSLPEGTPLTARCQHTEARSLSQVARTQDRLPNRRWASRLWLECLTLRQGSGTTTWPPLSVTPSASLHSAAPISVTFSSSTAPTPRLSSVSTRASPKGTANAVQAGAATAPPSAVAGSGPFSCTPWSRQNTAGKQWHRVCKGPAEGEFESLPRNRSCCA